MAMSASPAIAELRNETGTSDSDDLISKLRGMKSAVWIYYGYIRSICVSVHPALLQSDCLVPLCTSLKPGKVNMLVFLSKDF